jgi:hypothetical protein
MLRPVSAGKRRVTEAVNLCSEVSNARAPSSETQALIARRVRRTLPFLISEDSPGEHGHFALYTLADPRDVRGVRYVGQTRAPRRRYLQHVRSARLWLAAAQPWWIRLPRLRTLYVWIRELYADEQRLPFMLVSEWFASEAEAREQERCLITQLAERGLPLLNAEAERLRQTRPRTAATPAPGR